MAKFKNGDKVETVTGMVGKVIATDSDRGLVVVKATEHGVGHNPGKENTFKEAEVRKQ